MAKTFFQKRFTTYFLKAACVSLAISLVVLAVALPVICFVVSFSVRINRRVRYVEYLSQEIQKIREEGFGRTMELHDLRSPLTSIIGYVELLKETGPEDRQRFEEYMEVVERRLTGLNGLINELFEYTKLNSSGRFPDMEKRDVLELLRH